MKRVMIVDDAAFMRASLRMMLEKNAYEIVGEAEDGQAAVAKYLECNPDIVTMDITMPGMDGIATVKRIKAVDPRAKIVMVSAMGQESMVRDAILSGAKGFIVKPFKEQHIVEVLGKIG